MIRRKEILISILLSLSVAMCGCSSSEKQKSEETTGKSETVVTESTETSADDSSTSDTEKETTTESSTESETESSSEEESSTASSAIPENLSPDEMEKAFLQYCDDNGIQYFTSEENGGIRYECRELRFVVEKHPDSASAEKVYKEINALSNTASGAYRKEGYVADRRKKGKRCRPIIVRRKTGFPCSLFWLRRKTCTSVRKPSVKIR